MIHARHCPDCAKIMEWHGYYYYCPECDITQFPYLAKAIIGIVTITLLFFAVFLS